MAATQQTIDTVRSLGGDYKYGFVTDIESDLAPKGLNEDTVRFISAKKSEPQWLLDWRLKAFRIWQQEQEEEPTWARVTYPKIDYQEIYYYAAPKGKKQPESLNEVDPELLKTYEKLGIPLGERAALAGVAVDAVFDSISVATSFKDRLKDLGVIFCPISEAVREHPELVRKYLGSVVPYSDNYFATLNSAVFSDGSFVYVPSGVRCPMELSTYFRINAKMVALEDAEIRYATVQNWYPGDKDGKGGIYNFVTKRGACRGARARISWTQVETGSAITWKYPSVILQGDDSVGKFHSVAVTNNWQQADTGTKMIHIGRNTRSTIISKGISAGRGQNTYRGLVRIQPRAENARNYSQCDSLLIGSKCGGHTVPYIEVKNRTARVEHEATTSKISEDQLFYCRQRGLSAEDAVTVIVNGFCREVLQNLPMEFAVEAQKLLGVSLEGSVG